MTEPSQRSGASFRCERWRTRLTAATLAAVTLATCGQALAVDAGSQLRRFEDETRQRVQSRRPGPSPLPALPPSSSEAAAAASTARTHVSGFEVHGVTRFTQEEVAAVLREFAGRTLGAAEIHAAANALMRHYRRAGYFLAKVFVPPQTFGEVVRLDVEEGYLEASGIEVVNTGRRVETAAVRAILDAHLYSDRPLMRPDVERALLLADDLPGTTIGSILYPGAEVGTARLRAVMSDEPLIGGNVDVDNFNVEPLGQVRAGATFYVNSPGGVGDQVVGRFVTSGARSNYAYMTYLRPVAANGLRVGASLDYYGYDASALYGRGEIDGAASDARLYATYPLVRSRYTNLALRTDLSWFRIEDRRSQAGASFSAERRVKSLAVALHGDETHDLLPNGITLFDLAATIGRLDIAGDDAYARYDAAGPGTAGHFARVNFNLQRLQHIAGPWSALGSVGGQFASGNLDPSQRFYLGGPLSVPGYPVGEIGGDQGAQMHLELRRDFLPAWGGSLQAGAFYALGWVQQQKNPWPGWTAQDPRVSNNVVLQSVGLQLTQTFRDAWVIRALAGYQVGSGSPVRTLTGADSDGRTQDFRAWFQVIRYFGAR